MAIFGRHDYRDPAKEKFGKPTVSYPDNSILHPTLSEAFSHRKDSTTGVLPYLSLSQNPRALGCYLTKQAFAKGDDDSANLNVIYDRLPGVVKTTYPIEETYGLAMKVQTQVIIAQDNPPWLGPRWSAEFTLPSQPNVAETVTVGNRTYTFVTTLSGAANEILIGPTLQASLYNLASAINLDWGIGVNFGVDTVANGQAVAWFSIDTLIVADINGPSAPVAISTTCVEGSWSSDPVLVTTGSFTLTSNCSDGDTVTVGGKTYTFVIDVTGGGNVDGNVILGVNAAATMVNLHDAITLGGSPGTNYAAAMNPNAGATATSLVSETIALLAIGGPSQFFTSNTNFQWAQADYTSTQLYIEEKEIDINRVYRICSRVVLPLPQDLTYWFGHEVALPDTLSAVGMAWGESRSSGGATQDRNGYGGARAEASAAHYVDGSPIVQILNGFRGVAQAKYTRHFSVCPPNQDAIAVPTIIKPSLGTIIVGVQGQSLQQSNGDLGCSASCSGQVGYKSQRLGPVLTNGISLSNTPIKGLTVTMTAAGTGYSATSPPTVGFTGGTGSGAVGVAVVNASGGVSAVNMASQGNYSVVPTGVTFTDGGGGTDAEGTVNWVTIDNGTGSYMPADVTETAASPDGNEIYPAAQVSASAQGAASLNIPPSTPLVFTAGDLIVAAVQVQQMRLSLWMIETIEVEVPA